MLHGKFCAISLAAVGLGFTLSLPAAANTIDFDSLAAGVNLSNVYQISDGLDISTGSMPDATHLVPSGVMAGDIFTWTPISSTFRVLDSSPDAISVPQLALVDLDPLNDVLFTFSSPVTAFSLSTDNTSGEPVADIVRVIAVAPTGNLNEYLVLNVAEQMDDAVVLPNTFLSVSNGGNPFSHVIFQATTEQEGFDDLMFTPANVAAVPEPGAVALLVGATLSGSVLLRRRKVSR